MNNQTRSEKLQKLRGDLLAAQKQQLFEENFDLKRYEEANQAYLNGEEAKVDFTVQLPTDEVLLTDLRKENEESIASDKQLLTWISIGFAVAVLVLILCPGVWTYINDTKNADFLSVASWAQGFVVAAFFVALGFLPCAALFYILPDLCKELRKRKALA